MCEHMICKVHQNQTDGERRGKRDDCFWADCDNGVWHLLAPRRMQLLLLFCPIVIAGSKIRFNFEWATKLGITYMRMWCRRWKDVKNEFFFCSSAFGVRMYFSRPRLWLCIISNAKCKLMQSPNRGIYVHENWAEKEREMQRTTAN